MNFDIMINSLRGSPLNNFLLIHRGNMFMVNSSILKSISPKIEKLICDGIYEYTVPQIKGPFSDFVSILYGEEVEINQINCRYINFWAKDLEIDEIVQNVENFIFNNNIIENEVDFVIDLINNGFNPTSHICELAQNVEMLFEKFPPESLPVEFLIHLFNNDHFDVNSHFSILMQLMTIDQAKYQGLIKSINFRKISDDNLNSLHNNFFLDIPEVQTYLIQNMINNFFKEE